MLCYIDVEHDLVLNDISRRDRHFSMRMEEKFRFEQLTSLPCLLLRYTMVTRGWIERLNPITIIISGAQTDWSLYDRGDFDALLNLIRHWQGPMLGICAGHQLIARAFGVPTGQIRRLRPGEFDPRPDYGPGFFKEFGVQKIKVLQPDPLFDALPSVCEMVEEHYWEVKELPPGFQWLARTSFCAIQAYRHQSRPLYGTQFHPERYSAAHPHGQQLLRNFFQLARQYHGQGLKVGRDAHST